MQNPISSTVGPKRLAPDYASYGRVPGDQRLARRDEACAASVQHESGVDAAADTMGRRRRCSSPRRNPDGAAYNPSTHGHTEGARGRPKLYWAAEMGRLISGRSTGIKEQELVRNGRAPGAHCTVGEQRYAAAASALTAQPPRLRSTASSRRGSCRSSRHSRAARWPPRRTQATGRRVLESSRRVAPRAPGPGSACIAEAGAGAARGTRTRRDGSALCLM